MLYEHLPPVSGEGFGSPFFPGVNPGSVSGAITAGQPSFKLTTPDVFRGTEFGQLPGTRKTGAGLKNLSGVLFPGTVVP